MRSMTSDGELFYTFKLLLESRNKRRLIVIILTYRWPRLRSKISEHYA